MSIALTLCLQTVTVFGREIAPLRFALTFDDGPCGSEQDNPTEIILDTLAENPTQNGIKAIFFAQTRDPAGGATPRGRAVLQREHAEGHVLALHDGSALGHPNHRYLDDAALEQTLAAGVADLRAISGRSVAFVRPPYWAFDQRTVAAYTRHGLTMLLTDVSANDGKTWGFRASPRRHVHMAAEMARLRIRLERGEIPVVDGVIPIIVTFHDTNDYTAERMAEYLTILVEKAREAGLPLSAKPFYDQTASLERAAQQRAADVSRRADMVPWWWRWIEIVK